MGVQLSNFLPQALSTHARLEEVLRSVATYVVPKVRSIYIKFAFQNTSVTCGIQVSDLALLAA